MSFSIYFRIHHSYILSFPYPVHLSLLCKVHSAYLGCVLQEGALKEGVLKEGVLKKGVLKKGVLQEGVLKVCSAKAHATFLCFK